MAEIRQKVGFDCCDELGRVSIWKRGYLYDDGGYSTGHMVGDEHRAAVSPGQFDFVEEHYPTLAPALRALWTKEVIDEWNRWLDRDVAGHGLKREEMPECLKATYPE